MLRDTKGDRLSGKTVRWSFSEGPTKGKTYEHRFHDDGTVEFRAVEGQKSGEWTREKRYGTQEIANDVVVVSYLGGSGYTLTVALNFADGRMVGFASNDKEWYPVEGTFEEVVEEKARAA